MTTTRITQIELLFLITCKRKFYIIKVDRGYFWIWTILYSNAYKCVFSTYILDNTWTSFTNTYCFIINIIKFNILNFNFGTRNINAISFNIYKITIFYNWFNKLRFFFCRMKKKRYIFILFINLSISFNENFLNWKNFSIIKLKEINDSKIKIKKIIPPLSK